MRTITVCICTRNRPEELSSALESLCNGSIRATRVLVSDDSDENTQSATREVARTYGADYQVGPRNGLGANRNACVEVVETDLVAFIDDDVRVSPEFVAHAIGCTSEAITTGWEMNYYEARPKRVVSSNPSFLGFQKRPTKGAYSSIVINATVIPAHAFADIRFDSLTRYGYEELDFARHARANGWEIVHNPDLWVEHHPSPTGRDSYNSEIDISRLFLTRWAYFEYESNPIKASAYSIIAAAHLLAVSMRRRRSIRHALKTIAQANKKFEQRRTMESMRR